MITQEELIRIGTLARTHGKQGELQCRADNTYWDEADAEFVILMVDAIPVPFRVLDWRSKGADLLFTLQDVTTEDAALRLVGCAVYMLRRDVVAEDESLLSWQDIVGYQLSVLNSSSSSAIVEVDESTANILAVLQDGRLIPLHEDLIADINHKTKTITMTLPEGL